MKESKHLPYGYLVIILAFFILVFTIVFVTIYNMEADWTCELEFDFVTNEAPTWNLAKTTTSAYTAFTPNTKAIQYDNILSNWTAYKLVSENEEIWIPSTVQPSENEEYCFDPTLMSRFLVRGHVPSQEQCLESIQKQWCAASTVQNSSIINNNVKVYKFTYSSKSKYSSSDLNLKFKYPNINLTNSNSSRPIYSDIFGGDVYPSIFQAFGTNEYFLAVSNDIDVDLNFCDVSQQIVANGDAVWQIVLYEAWGPELEDYDVTGFSYDVEVECEEINFEYCVLDVTQQITKPIDLPFTLKRYLEQHEHQYLLLSSELGSECGQRWEKICLDSFDAIGLCKELYSSPFVCNKKQHNYIWAIISSFASAVLFWCVGRFFQRDSKPVIVDTADANGHKLLR